MCGCCVQDVTPRFGDFVVHSFPRPPPLSSRRSYQYMADPATLGVLPGGPVRALKLAMRHLAMWPPPVD